MVKVFKFEEDNVNSAHFCGFIRLQSTDLNCNPYKTKLNRA